MILIKNMYNLCGLRAFLLGIANVLKNGYTFHPSLMSISVHCQIIVTSLIKYKLSRSMSNEKHLFSQINVQQNKRWLSTWMWPKLCSAIAYKANRFFLFCELYKQKKKTNLATLRTHHVCRNFVTSFFLLLCTVLKPKQL